MRHGTSGRRQRNRGNGNGGQRRGNQQRMQVFDSNGPDVRIRGTAHQVTEKYMALAKDAAASGDPVLAQSYLQHAEHYQRVINSWGVDVHDARNDLGESGENSAADENDLSLPTSILGDSPEVTSKRTIETASAG